MTITAYTGLPGAGKSYSVVKHVIVPALEKGIKVYTNIPVNDTALIEQYGMSVEAIDLEEIKTTDNWYHDVFESGSVFVMDEVWRMWPSGLMPNKIAEKDKSFFAEHRHMVGANGRSTEIVLVTQDLAQVAKFVRDLVETTYRTTKLNKAGMDGKYRVDVYHGAATGQNPPPATKMQSFMGSYEEKITSLYKSHTMGDQVGDETVIDNRNNVLGSWQVKAFAITIPLLVVFSFIKIKAFFSSDSTVDIIETANASSDKQSSPGVVRNHYAVKPVTIDDPFENASFSIWSNIGVRPNIEYVIRITQGGHSSNFSQFELKRLGYRLTSINACAVKLTGPKTTHLVMCESNEKTSPPVISKSFNPFNVGGS